ncbi:coxsackievirus and adenovirus receptor homolog [Lates japonicus]|uniref:Coxsackievirus and adenovirus receptor homolog n=1 Tax=Lates japonicus TaxID=270547 RepID=A0AAD3R0E6_LATJO|nr:coxsackievirus and adenovirus receptor homolog [Lates japonicus]
MQVGRRHGAQYDKIPSSEDYERPPSHAPVPPPTSAKMAGPNLSRMGGHPCHDPSPEQGWLNCLACPVVKKGP